MVKFFSKPSCYLYSVSYFIYSAIIYIYKSGQQDTVETMWRPWWCDHFSTTVVSKSLYYSSTLYSTTIISICQIIDQINTELKKISFPLYTWFQFQQHSHTRHWIAMSFPPIPGNAFSVLRWTIESIQIAIVTTGVPPTTFVELCTVVCCHFIIIIIIGSELLAIVPV